MIEMKKSVLLVMLAILFSAPAAMASSGDMFDDSYVDSSNRPRVPSDDGRREDMLPAAPPISNSNYDLFDHMSPGYLSPDADMLKAHDRHVDYGRDDMFVDRPAGEDYHPLFHRGQ